MPQHPGRAKLQVRFPEGCIDSFVGSSMVLCAFGMFFLAANAYSSPACVSEGKCDLFGTEGGTHTIGLPGVVCCCCLPFIHGWYVVVSRDLLVVVVVVRVLPVSTTGTMWLVQNEWRRNKNPANMKSMTGKQERKARPRINLEKEGKKCASPHLQKHQHIETC